MSNEAPTDALRLVPLLPTPEMVSAATEAFHSLNPSVFSIIWSAMLAAAPASPLPGGGDMDWQDKAEGLESDLRQAVLVAWKRGAEEWCRLNYPQWVDWLEACHTPAARAFLARNGKGEG